MVMRTVSPALIAWPLERKQTTSKPLGLKQLPTVWLLVTSKTTPLVKPPKVVPLGKVIVILALDPDRRVVAVKFTTYTVRAPAPADGEALATVTFETELALAGGALIRSAAI